MYFVLRDGEGEVVGGEFFERVTGFEGPGLDLVNQHLKTKIDHVEKGQEKGRIE